MLDRSEVGRRGYLHENFRLFHLKDSRAEKMEYHYHEFDKIILLLSCRVTYVVEGVSYFLRPWDILLVQHNMIHVPRIDPSEPYERIVLWLNADYLEHSSTPGQSLSTRFDVSRQRGFHLLRQPTERRLEYMRLIRQLEEALRDEQFGHELLANTTFLQLLIAINRDILQDHTAEDTATYSCDPKMEEILRYIAAHLEEELSVEALASRFYLSRYYLMHRFKAITGYTVHQYISQKRLLRAGELIRAGTPVMKAAEAVGFREYSTFLRAFQNTFHVSPREFHK